MNAERYRPYLSQSTIEEEMPLWPPQPDWGPSHVKYPWELVPGNTYLLHEIMINENTGEREEVVEEFKVESVSQQEQARPYLRRKVYYTKKLSDLPADRERKLFGQYSFEDVGLMPHAKFSYFQCAFDDGLKIHPERYVYTYHWEQERWIEDPLKSKSPKE